MKFRPRPRAIAALIALVSMLFMQLAVAGYVCPKMTIAVVGALENSTIGAIHQGMEGCEGMDQVQSNLCQAHDQIGTQSLDKPALPLVQPFIAGALTLVFRELDVAAVRMTAQPNFLGLTRTTAPPFSIQHCCFRI